MLCYDLWKKKYLKDGLLSELPGWMFNDWDFEDDTIIG